MSEAPARARGTPSPSSAAPSVLILASHRLFGSALEQVLREQALSVEVAGLDAGERPEGVRERVARWLGGHPEGAVLVLNADLERQVCPLGELARPERILCLSLWENKGYDCRAFCRAASVRPQDGRMLAELLAAWRAARGAEPVGGDGR